jgi:hypothetical protein
MERGTMITAHWTLLWDIPGVPETRAWRISENDSWFYVRNLALASALRVRWSPGLSDTLVSVDLV